MDHRMLDRLVPLGYAVLILASALFFSAALAGIAIFGALALAMYYTAIRQRLIYAERAAAAAADDAGEGQRPHAE